MKKSKFWYLINRPNVGETFLESFLMQSRINQFF